MNTVFPEHQDPVIPAGGITAGHKHKQTASLIANLGGKAVLLQRRFIQISIKPSRYCYFLSIKVKRHRLNLDTRNVPIHAQSRAPINFEDRPIQLLSVGNGVLRRLKRTSSEDQFSCMLACLL